MKKTLALLLALAMVLCLAACGNQAKPGEISEDALVRSINPDAIGAKSGKNMVRGGVTTSTNFDGVPAVQDRAEYLEDGRLQLTSQGLKIIFDIPFGWLLLTQDTEGQHEDYEMYVSDAASLVADMQKGSINAIALTADGEELHVYVEKTALSEYLRDSNLLTESSAKELTEAIKQANPVFSDIYCAKIGERNFIIYEVEAQGIVVFSTIVNDTDVSLSYQVTEETTEARFKAVESFLANIEFEAAK